MENPFAEAARILEDRDFGRNLWKLSACIHDMNKEKGFWDDVPTGAGLDKLLMFLAVKVALVHTEVSELLEAFRKCDEDNMREEVADILIRLLDLTSYLRIDVASAMRDKLAANAKRPHKHGKLF